MKKVIKKNIKKMKKNVLNVLAKTIPLCIVTKIEFLCVLFVLAATTTI